MRIITLCLLACLGLLGCTSAADNNTTDNTNNTSPNTNSQGLEPSWSLKLAGSETLQASGTGVGLTYTGAARRAAMILDTDMDAVAGTNQDGPARVSIQLSQIESGATGRIEGAGKLTASFELRDTQLACTPALTFDGSHVEIIRNDETGLRATFELALTCAADADTTLDFTLSGELTHSGGF